MSINYIEKIPAEHGINIKIHKNGKVCTLTNPNNIKILLNICHKHNVYFKNKKIIENANPIIKEFDSYIANKKKKNQKIKIIPNNINKLVDKFKLVRRMPTKGKIVIAASLATTIGMSGIIISSIKGSKSEPVNTPIATIEEVPEYIDDSENTNISNNIDDIIVNYDSEFVIDEEIENTELNQMLQADQFHFTYNDRTDSPSLSNAKRYEDLFIKYGNMYGIDSNLLIAMAAQESSGEHYDNLTGGSAMGIMQIEKNVFIGSTISAYNFETQEIDKVKITKDSLEDLETNIKIGTIILRNNLEQNNYNIPLSLQTYNFGPGNMEDVFEAAGITKSDARNNVTNPEWLDYRTTVHAGDPKYIEHVFSYIQPGTVLTIKDRDNNDVDIQIINDEAFSLQI